MNDVIKAIESRRSIRKFKSDMPPRENIDEIIEAGRYAASAMGMQSTITIAITNKEMRDKLAKANAQVGGWDTGFDPFYNAPVILVVLGDKSWSNRVYDGSLVMGNMMLAAHSLGFGSIWIHRAKEVFELPEWKEILNEIGVKGEWEGIGNCAIGYIDGNVPTAAKRKEDRVFWIK